MAAAVDVVELALGDRVVDVDRREQQRARVLHLVQPVHAGRRLFGDAADALGDLRPAAGMRLELLAGGLENHAPLFRLVGLVERRHVARLLELVGLVHEERRVAAVVHNQRRAAAIGPHERFGRAPPVLVERLALPREHRNAARIVGRAAGLRTADRDGRGRVILRREDVARHPPHVGTQFGQRLDQHRGLNRHVQRAHDARTGERLGLAIALTQHHQARHLLLGEADFLAAPLGETEIGHFVREAARLAGEVVNVFGA